MVTVADVKYLAQLEGIDLIRGAAEVTGLGGLILNPLLEIGTQHRQALENLSRSWVNIQDMLSEHSQTMQRTTQRVLDDWDGDAADGFSTYMGRFFHVSEDQHREIGEIIAGLDTMAGALKEAEDGLDSSVFHAAMALAGTIAGCLYAISQGGVRAALITAAIGILGALGIFLGEVYHILGKKADTISDAVAKVKLAHDEAVAGSPALSAVQLPPEPEITGPGLGTILNNLDSEFYWDN